MGDNISNQELRRRLLSFNTVVPPVTESTRKLLLKKLADLESNQSNKTGTSKIMPPPKPKTPSNSTNESIMISSSMNGRKQSQHLIFNIDSTRKSTRRRRQALDTFDASDSEVDSSSLGHSILPANPYITSSSPKSSEVSLMNVSTKTYTVDEYDDQNSYSSSPEKKRTPKKRSKVATKLFDSTVNKSSTEPTTRKLRSTPPTKVSSSADLAIKRWQGKIMNQLQNQNNVSSTSQFSLASLIPKVPSTNLRYQGNYFTKSTRNIILLIAGFFVLVFGLYFVSIQSSTSVLPSGILNSLCAKKNLQGFKCDEEQEKLQRIFNLVVSLVQDKYIKNQCDKPEIEPTINARTLYEYISTHEKIDAREIEEIVELFKSIAKTYSDSPIGYDTSFHINVQPSLPVMCTVKNIFSNMFYLITWIGIVAMSVVGLYFVICYISTKSENYKLEMNKLIEDTINLLKQQAINHPNENFLPIIHIRDNLIPFDERQSKSKMWAEVVQYFTESESSVRSDVQEIDGEDFKVWKWITPMSPSINN